MPYVKITQLFYCEVKSDVNSTCTCTSFFFVWEVLVDHLFLYACRIKHAKILKKKGNMYMYMYHE